MDRIAASNAADQPPQPAAGETWAYRARSTDPLAPVSVLRFGSKRPIRVLVRFIDEASEGVEDWVPPARLKARWDQVQAFIEREGRWNAVVGDDEVFDTPEYWAASIVFDHHIDRALADTGYNASAGTVTIHDVDGLASLLGIEPAALSSDPLAFVDERGLVAPWATTRLIAVRAAERTADEILRYVAKEEADARQEAAYGHFYRARGGRPEDWIPPEICAESDEEHGRPVRAVLRQWCGAEAVDRHDELRALRAEVARLGGLVESATSALRRLGARDEAERFERDLGVPVEVLRRR